jgi:predicted alpha/beta superfamily hydrolase
MCKKSFIFLFCCCSFIATAQHHVIITVINLPPEPRSYDLFMAGSFNGWRPADDKFMFQRKGTGQFYIELKLAAGNYEYKITRGGWDKVECTKNGFIVPNRLLKVTSDTLITIDVEEWQDNFKAKPKTSTASANVKVMDTAFSIPQLKRTRRIWIYLPEGYSKNQKARYPVLYLHDGQNVFDDATSFSGEWGVDEFLDTTHLQKPIVVAIDNGGNKRMNEYCPYDFSTKNFSNGKGEGSLYVDFLVKTLKPYIDNNYRTKKERQHTLVAGSSMGGLISMYAVLKYPKVFGGAGVFSPSFWIAPKIYDDVKQKGGKVRAKIYFYAGGEESEEMVPDMMKAADLIKKFSRSSIKTVVNDKGKHHEPSWRNEFPAFCKWLIK